MRHDARCTTSICSTSMHLYLHWHGHAHLHSFVVKTKMAAIPGNGGGGGDGESIDWSIIQILARFPKSVIEVSSVLY